MADAFDEAFRLLAEHKRQSLKLAPQRELEEEILREEQRRSTWMDVPEWRTFWDEGMRDFKVPDGWPSGMKPEASQVEGPDARNTFMHKALRGETA